MSDPMKTTDVDAEQRAVHLMKRQQRAALWALLAVRRTIRQALRSAIKPNFEWLQKLMKYVERYAENIHQPNEDHMLFNAVARREPMLARTVARLRRDHATMKGYGNRLRATLTYWQQGDRAAGPLAVAVADDYAFFCLRHMRSERRDLLPAARNLLTISDWRSAGQAFEAAADPLALSRNEGERISALQRLH